MSDPAANVEIEDVLASVRRLVSSDRREPVKRPAPSEEPDKLVLTPDFRVGGIAPELEHQPDLGFSSPEPDTERDDLHGTFEDAPEPGTEAPVAEDVSSFDAAANGVPADDDADWDEAIGELPETDLPEPELPEPELVEVRYPETEESDSGEDLAGGLEETVDDPAEAEHKARILTLEERIAQLEAAVTAHSTTADFEPDGSEDQEQHIPHAIVGHEATEYGDESTEDLRIRFTSVPTGEDEGDFADEESPEANSADESGPLPGGEDFEFRHDSDYAAKLASAFRISEPDEDEALSQPEPEVAEPEASQDLEEVEASEDEAPTDSILEAEAILDAFADEDASEADTSDAELMDDTAVEPADLADVEANDDVEEAELPADPLTLYAHEAEPGSDDANQIDESDPAHLEGFDDTPEPQFVDDRTVPFPNRVQRKGEAAAERPEASDQNKDYGDWEDRIYNFDPDTEVGGLDFDNDTQEIDEDMLRDMVAEIVREELQGALGERITRNVRKLVRREIMRALSIREFE